MSEKYNKETELGAGWIRKTKDNTSFLKGVLKLNGKEVKFVAWKSREKKSEKSPDYRFYIDTFEPNKGKSTDKQNQASEVNTSNVEL